MRSATDEPGAYLTALVGTAPLVADIPSFFAQDLDACRRLQQATASPRSALGPLAARHEAPIGHLHAARRERLVDALR